MRKGRYPQKNAKQRAHIIELYQQLTRSIHEAQSMQSVVEKEQQMQRLLRYLRGERQLTN